MRFRKLRILFSAVCGILCVLLIALWVRSYWRWDIIHGVLIANSPSLGLQSVQGGIDFSILGSGNPRGLSADSFRIIDLGRDIAVDRDNIIDRGPDYVTLTLPHWFLVLSSGALSAVPWTKWSFSLRTLLIATALFAVVVGALIYRAR